MYAQANASQETQVTRATLAVAVFSAVDQLLLRRLSQRRIGSNIPSPSPREDVLFLKHSTVGTSWAWLRIQCQIEGICDSYLRAIAHQSWFVRTSKTKKAHLQ